MTIQKVKNGKVILFDSSDWPLIEKYRWRINPKSNYVMSFDYISTGISKTLYMHRIVMNVIDTDNIIDHINGNKLDNRRLNLRLATSTQNSQNARSKRGKSKYKGIIFMPYRGKETIVARIVVNKKQIYLGTHKTEESAALAYNVAAVKYFGEFANLNKV